MDHWQDRITPAQYAKIAAELKKFRTSNQSRNMQHRLYAVMTDNGLTAEEADESINMEMAS